MKALKLIAILTGSLFYTICNAQGYGLGYNFHVGWQNYTEVGEDYSQRRFSIIHEGLFRIHNPSGSNSVQFGMGFRSDYIPFTNESQFLDHDGITISRYNTDAVLYRKAWRMSLTDNIQFGGMPGKSLMALTGGIFMETTLDMQRREHGSEFVYDLEDEIRPVIAGIILGAEVRMRWITFGYKFEKSFCDILDHDYINSLRLRRDNSSELRGLRLGTSMSILYVGIALDFFHD